MHLIPTKIHSVGSATMPRRVAVDPRFGARLRELRRQRQLSLRELAERAHQGTSYIGELETGQKQPTVDVAANLDRALAANGKLARNPRHIDTTTIDSLHAILAHQRRLEDSIGSAPLVSPVRTQVAMLEHLVEEAPDNDRRRTLLDTAAQWAQFAAWLTTTTGNHVEGRDRYLRTMEWATEAGNPHMAATALSMREHLAWVQGRYRSMIELSRAAAWQPASLGVRALAVQQENRGLALIGDADGSDHTMAQAEEMASEAAQP